MVEQKNRKGFTKITSVSVSNEMTKIIEFYNLSPTEVFRRGLGVSLSDLGVEPYSVSTLNKERSIYVKKFIEGLNDAEKLDDYSQNLDTIKKFNRNKNKIIKDLKNALKEIKKMEELE